VVRLSSILHIHIGQSRATASIAAERMLSANPMALSFATDIRPLFRDTPDVDIMKEYGLDLSLYADVKVHALAIYALVADGSMPCDERWPAGRVALFKRWVDEGMAP
jgi:hypothetical protein